MSDPNTIVEWRSPGPNGEWHRVTSESIPGSAHYTIKKEKRKEIGDDWETLWATEADTLEVVP